MLKCSVKDECLKTSQPDNGTCETDVACFKVTKQLKDGSCREAGCFDDLNLVRFYCKNQLNEVASYNRTQVLCCNQGDYCNQIKSGGEPKANLVGSSRQTEIICIFALILVMLAIGLMYKRSKSNKKNRPDQLESVLVSEPSSFQRNPVSCLQKDITLLESIGEGRYGRVVKGLYNDQQVAVKMFNSSDYDSYKREEAIYMIPSLSRESILKCIGVHKEFIDCSGMEYWLILDFCALGSLYDYLQNRVLKKGQLLSIMLSAISGLNHLHDEQAFTISKPAISHRDIKSKNLLMRTDRTVCIADFGLSITKDEIQSKQYPKVQSGTKRYFSPEALDETLDVRCFESFASADVYAYALVFWESLNQSEFNPQAGTFHLPYHEYTRSDPSIDEMKEVVVVQGRRPKLFDDECGHHEGESTLTSICAVVRRCWSSEPKDRLSSFQIKDKLDDLCRKLNKV